MTSLGASIALNVENSLGSSTAGLLLVGLGPTRIPTPLGGEFLVYFPQMLPIAIPGAGYSLPIEIPTGCSCLAGSSAYLQALAMDSGASHGISFTPGLRLFFGR